MNDNDPPSPADPTSAPPGAAPSATVPGEPAPEALAPSEPKSGDAAAPRAETRREDAPASTAAPAVNTVAPAASDEAARVSPSTAALFGWILAALFAAIGILLVKRPKAVVFWTSLGYDVGHHVAAGFVAAAMVGVWCRWLAARDSKSRRWIWGIALIAIFAGAAGWPFLSPDLDGAADKVKILGLPLGARLALFVIGSAMAVPIAALVGRFLARRYWRWAGVFVAAGAMFVHPRVLDGNYPGLHLLGTFAAATLAGACLSGAIWPPPLRGLTRYLTTPTPRLGRVGEVLSISASWIPLFVLSLWGAWSFVAQVSDKIVVFTLRRPSAAFAPFVSALHAESAEEDVKVGGEWWTQRQKHAGIAATTPALVASPIVVLITVDAFRADVLTTDEHCAKLPRLCALRRESLCFTTARAPASATGPSLGSLFTQKYYSQLYWAPKKGQDKVFLHEDKTPRFPALLTKAHVDTFAYYGRAGFHSDTGVIAGFAKEQQPGLWADSILGAMAKRVAEQEEKPLFVYAHLMEPHAPYDAPGDTPFEKYLGEIAKVDVEIGKLLDAIERAGKKDRTIVMISADHGEAFGEHNTKNHATTVYDELLRIPLIARVPGVAPRAVDTPVSLIDLGPTILDLCGAKTPGEAMGQSLVPLFRDPKATLSRPIAADSGRQLQAMVFPNGIKVIRDIRHGTTEVYDLTKDPAELDDITDDAPDLARDHVKLMKAFFASHQLKKPGYKPPYRR